MGNFNVCAVWGVLRRDARTYMQIYQCAQPWHRVCVCVCSGIYNLFILKNWTIPSPIELKFIYRTKETERGVGGVKWYSKKIELELLYIEHIYFCIYWGILHTYVKIEAWRAIDIYCIKTFKRLYSSICTHICADTANATTKYI